MCRLVLAMGLLLVGCATHVTTLSVRAERDRWHEFKILGETIARELEFTRQPEPRSETMTTTTDPFVSLGMYVRDHPDEERTTGSYAYLVLFVFAEIDPPVLNFRLFDYSHGHETEFAAQVRDAIKQRLVELAPEEQVRVSHKRIRALPP
jgi:hypothetical protein